MIGSNPFPVAARGAEVPVADPRLAAYVGDLAVDTVDPGSAAQTESVSEVEASVAQPTSDANSSSESDGTQAIT